MTIDAPLALHSEKIIPEWIDYNGHMNLSYYVLVFDHATDAFLDYVGIDQDFRNRKQSSTFAAEIHVTYESEVGLGETVRVTTQLLGFDEKRIHYFHEMFHADSNKLVATNELMSLYMDMQARRVSAMPQQIQQRLADIDSVHSKLALPSQVGRIIGLKSRTG